MKRTKHKQTKLSGFAKNVVFLLCSFVLLWGTGCSSNFIVRHKSFRTKKSIHVYIDKKLVCVVSPQKKCAKNLKKGRHVFYAEVKGNRSQRWGKKVSPTPFAIDKKTIIDLHDPTFHKAAKK